MTVLVQSVVVQSRGSSTQLGERFDAARHAQILEGGRVLLRSAESVIAIEEPFMLASRSDNAHLELLLRRLSTFAIVLSTIITTLVVLRAAPVHFTVVIVIWVGGAVFSRLFIRRRRAEHARILVDFDSGQLTALPVQGAEIVAPLSVCNVRTQRSGDAEAPIWILLFVEGREGGHPLRMGRGIEPDVDRVLSTLRRFHVAVDRQHDGAL